VEIKLNKWNKLKKWQKVLIVIGILALLGGILGDKEKPTTSTANNIPISSTMSPSPVPTLTPEQKEAKEKEARKNKIDSQFSGYDGSHHNLERFIKQSMNDPDSYEHVSTRYWDQGENIVIVTSFRGTNAFGGKVVNTIKVKANLEGEILEILK